MHVLEWFDNRTLIACDFIVSVAFAIVFFGMKRSYPTLRGINTVAISFLLGVPGTFLIASRGMVPYFVSVTIAYCFLFGAFVFLYRGILRFIGSRRSAIIPILVSCLALVVLFYFSEIQESIVPRVVAVSVTIGIVRGLIAMELFRKSPTFTSPKAMRLFAAFMAVFAAISVNFAIITIVHVSPDHILESTPTGTATLLSGIIFILCVGLFLLVLSSGELIARSRDESQKDVLSGVFNRRGIEIKLAAALKHVQRGRNKLSIALIDVDYFKSINDIQGHAAGDAALREVAETISTHLRGRDHLGRYGGDEFLLILPNTPVGIALGVTDRLNKAVSDRTSTGAGMPLTLSIGLTEATLDDNAVTLIARADKALYQAKADGRNCRRVVTADATPEQTPAAEQPVAIADVVLPTTGSTLLH